MNLILKIIFNGNGNDFSNFMITFSLLGEEGQNVIFLELSGKSASKSSQFPLKKGMENTDQNRGKRKYESRIICFCSFNIWNDLYRLDTLCD